MANWIVSVKHLHADGAFASFHQLTCVFNLPKTHFCSYLQISDFIRITSLIIPVFLLLPWLTPFFFILILTPKVPFQSYITLSSCANLQPLITYALLQYRDRDWGLAVSFETCPHIIYLCPSWGLTMQSSSQSPLVKKQTSLHLSCFTSLHLTSWSNYMQSCN